MQTGVSASPGYYVQGTIGSGANQYGISNTTILGTPDVNLQPVLKCNPKSGLGARTSTSTARASACPHSAPTVRPSSPTRTGRRSSTRDLTLEKGFSIGGERHLRFRYAAFNFLNHPLNSFGTGYASQTTLQLSDTSANATPQTATYNPATGFGAAPLKLGRRLSEVSLKFDF